MSTPRIVELGGKKFEIVLGTEIHGICPRPGETPAIVIVDSLHTRMGLDTLIHECLHAQNPARSESWIRERAKELTAVLWRLGFRRSG